MRQQFFGAYNHSSIRIKNSSQSSSQKEIQCHTNSKYSHNRLIQIIHRPMQQILYIIHFTLHLQFHILFRPFQTIPQLLHLFFNIRIGNTRIESIHNDFLGVELRLEVLDLCCVGCKLLGEVVECIAEIEGEGGEAK